MILLSRVFLCNCLLVISIGTLAAQAPQRNVAADESQSASGGQPPSSADPAEFQLGPGVREAIEPLIDAIRGAKVSRATVNMLADSVLSGETLSKTEARFQLASRAAEGQAAGKFTVYMKQPEQRTRIFCDGDLMVVAMAADAYFELPAGISIQDAVTSLPVPLGPYPEPLMALCMASCDPALSLMAGMRSIELIDRKPFRSKVPAIHLRGIQSDLVQWDLWLADEPVPRPLRLLIDLTPMLTASKDVHVPDGYSSQIRYDFLTWRLAGEVSDSLFKFRPASNAIKYDSLEHYFDTVAGSKPNHGLVAKPVPEFVAKTLGDQEFSSERLADKVVVLDFFASWCEACKVGLPTIKKVTDAYRDKGVVFIAINTGEDKEKAVEFLKQEKLRLNLILDDDGKVADAFEVESLPQTYVIGKDGVIESVHLGFVDEKSLTTRLTDELEILTIGGKIGSANAEQ